MKIRRLRKLKQAAFKHRMAYYWSVQKLANRIAWAYEPLGKMFHDAVTKGVFHSVIMDDNGQIKVVEIPMEEVYE